MALDQKRLEDLIVAKMEAEGATEEGEFSWVRKIASAVSKAVVEEITANAKAAVGSGSSAGDWPIE
ncbi:hypothetical protein [Vibrio fluvialis]|uniref:hypothetical protein n=1 Tax=Vibrio fluvialis TaxID=676 RepID=UPI001C9D6539|nr:hypothetical protein [Vibrio fluvialis]MBY8314506.1 hypothetical protein [Vibrio fluvialis]MCE7659381.1 hypothetical protein [Vibrio fluvialis]WDY55231.1 hypothetical protein PUN47_17895 [Vibrio fluvialis]